MVDVDPDLDISRFLTALMAFGLAVIIDNESRISSMNRVLLRVIIMCSWPLG
jgi:hypothetical protein